MPSVRDMATLIVSDAVSGADTRRYFGRQRSGPVTVEHVHPLVLATARERLREGERLVIVSPTTVRLVPR